MLKSLPKTASEVYLINLAEGKYYDDMRSLMSSNAYWHWWTFYFAKRV